MTRLSVVVVIALAAVAALAQSRPASQPAAKAATRAAAKHASRPTSQAASRAASQAASRPTEPAAAGDWEFLRRNFVASAEAYRSAPPTATNLYKLGLALMQMAQAAPPAQRGNVLAQARESLRRSVAVDANHLDAHRVLAEIAWMSGVQTNRWTDFIAEADQLLALADKDDFTYVKRAMARSEDLAGAPDAARIALAESDFRKAVQLKPQEANYWMEYIRFLQRYRPAQIEATFEEAVAAAPSDLSIRGNYASYLRSVGKKELALKQADLCIAGDPNRAMAYVIRSQHFLELRNLDEAMKSAREGLAKDDLEPRAYSQVAALEVMRGRADLAVTAFRSGITAVEARLKGELPPDEKERLQEASLTLNTALGSLLLESLDARGADRVLILQQLRQCVTAVEALQPQGYMRARLAGLLAHAEERAGQAALLLEQALVQPNDRIDAQVARALVRDYARVGQAKRAISLLNQLLQQPGGSKNPAIPALMAEVDMHSHEYDAAGAHLAESLRIEPNYPPAVALQVVLALVRGAPSSLPAGFDLPLECADLVVLRGQQMLAERNPDGLTLVEDVHRRLPTHRTAITQLLQMYSVAQKKAEFEALLQQVRTSDPAFARDLQDEITLAQEKDPQKRFDLMKARVERVLPAGLARALAMANLCEQAGKEKEYAQCLEEAAGLDPNWPEVIERNFDYYGGRKDWDAAEQWVDRATQVNADGVGGRYYGLRLALGRQDANAAAQRVEEAAKINPQWRIGKLMLARSYVESRELQKARPLFKEVVDAEPNNGAAVIGLAMVSGMELKTQEHYEWIKRAMQLPEGPKNQYVVSSYIDMRQALAKPEEIPEVMELRRQMMAQNPRDLQNAYSLAQLCEQAGRDGEAKSIYTHIYTVTPNKLAGVRPLAEFLGRSGQNSALIELLSKLEESETDKTGARVVKAQYMRYYSPELALRVLEQAIEADPNDTRPYEAMAQYHEAKRNYKDAIATWARLQEFPASRSDASKAIARCLLAGHDYSSADKQLASLLLETPDDVELLMLQASLNMRMRLFEQSLQTYDKVLKKDPNHVMATLSRLYVLLAMGDYQQLRAELALLRGKNFGPEALMEYASISQQIGDAQAAELAYLDILKTQRNYLPALRAMMSMHAERKDWTSLEGPLLELRKTHPKDLTFALMEAQMWKGRNATDKAVAALEAAVQISPASLEAVGAYLTTLIDAKRYDRLLAVVDPFTTRSETAAMALAAKARALVATNRGNDAEDAFVAAVSGQVTPRQLGMIGHQLSQCYGPAKAAEKLSIWVTQKQLLNPSLGVLMGMFYAEANDIPRSIQVLTTAREKMKTPEDKAAVNGWLASIYYKDRQLAAARDAYLEMLKVLPEDSQTLNNLAYLYAEDLKDPNSALPYGKRAMELAPGNPSILDTYGWILVQIGRPKDALTILSRAVNMMPDSAVLRLHLGTAMEQCNLADDARRQYETGLKNATDPGVKKTLQDSVNRLKPAQKK